MRDTWLGDLSGAVADLGVLVPLVAALVLKNGLDAGTVLVGVGALYVAAGLWFRVPVPVQPIKAAAAIAIARHLPPAELAAAGLLLGAVLTLAAVTGLANLASRVFTKPIVRGIQLGVGLLLLRSAVKLPGPHPSLAVAATAAVIATGLLAVRRRGLPLAAAVVGLGVAWSLATGTHPHLHAGLWHPTIGAKAFSPSLLASAFVVLVIPQLPLTFGNAVVALTDVEHRYFGDRAARVSPRSVSLSCGLANMAAGTLGGMPMCHGSGGLTAHYQAGGRTYRLNLIVGVPLLAAGLVLGPAAVGLLRLVPIAVLAGLLAFTGLLHGALVAELRGYDLALAVAMGVAGLATGNLAVSLAVGLAGQVVSLACRALKHRTATSPSS